MKAYNEYQVLELLNKLLQDMENKISVGNCATYDLIDMVRELRDNIFMECFPW